ncbi:MAG: diaminopimelate epimerase [Myxococcota bacterium]
MRFAKYEGLGNDFIVVQAAVDAAQARALCDRHRGVGADGVLIVDPSERSMRVINADGSVPEMCGNGLRCVVWHLERTGAASGELVMQTDAGPHRCWIHGPGDIEVEMRGAVFEPASVPVQAAAPMIDAPFLDDVRLTAVSMGNPHAVTFDAVSEATEFAKRVQGDARFPEGVNVGFGASIDGGFSLRVYERGVGWTEACGTGACAAAAAAVATDRASKDTPIAIELPGGRLTIVVQDGAVRMRGPARHVFDGETSL